MHSFRISLFSALLTFGCPSLLSAQSACDSFECVEAGSVQQCHGGWWASADAMFLDRSQKYNGVLVIDENALGAPVLTGDSLQFESVAGPRLALGRTWKSGIDSEFVYFGLHDWGTTARVDGNNNLSMPGDIGLATADFFAADSMAISYGSRIHNVEGNLWIPFGKLEGMVGFRYFGVNEDLNYESFDSDTFQSNYLVDTNNQLFGGQIGVRRRWCHGALSFRPEAKFGVFANANEQSTLLRDLNNTVVLRDVSVEDNVTSTLSEIRLVGDVALTKHFCVGFGYNLLWLTDLALAPNQLDFTDTAFSSQFVDNNHSIFLHGATVGITLTR